MPVSVTSLQRQAKALGEPTRYRIFQIVADETKPVSVADLTEPLELTPNAVRKHLAQLVAVGLVEERSGTPAGRGRPPLLYSVAPTALSRWGTVGPYERLSGWLAEIVRTGDAPIDVGRRIGRREPVGHSDDEPVDRLVAEMKRQGFEPDLASSSDEASAEITLRQCPFESVAAADQATVCGLHRGIIEGTAEAIGHLVVDDLVVSQPGTHNCHIHCHQD